MRALRTTANHRETSLYHIPSLHLPWMRLYLAMILLEEIQLLCLSPIWSSLGSEKASSKPRVTQPAKAQRQTFNCSPSPPATPLQLLWRQLPCRWESLTWDYLQRREGGLLHISSWGSMHHLNKGPGPDADIVHSLLREAETGQASRRFIRGTSRHIRTAIKEELKSGPVGEAQSCSGSCACRIWEEGGRAGARGSRAGEGERGC